MGSFQQICLGAICLFAAYMFGNYVNNNPPPLHSNVQNLAGGATETLNGLAANATQSVTTGNIESKLPLSDFSPIENKPAPIVTMRTPLKSRFAVPSVQTVPSELGFNGFNGSQTNKPLPPPSQLAESTQQPAPAFSDKPFSSNLFAEPAAVEPAIQVPDFSAIAAEFKNTPIELPNMSRLGGMPSHSNGNQAQPNHFGNWQHTDSSNQRLKQLVRKLPDNDFRNQNLPSGPGEYYAQQQSQQFQANEANAQTEPASPNQAFAPTQGFTQADFEPKLNDDIFGLKPRPNRYENQQPDNERLQAVSQGPVGDYEYVTPPAPPESFDYDDRTSSGFRGNLTFRPDLENRRGDSRNVQSGNRGLASVTPMEYPPQAPPNRYRENQSSRLPFRLTDQAKTELVQLRDRADSMIGLESTKFVDHTIRNGESLQSISAQYFGSPNYYLDIYLANRNKLRNPADAQAGVSIRVPVYDSP